MVAAETAVDSVFSSVPKEERGERVKYSIREGMAGHLAYGPAIQAARDLIKSPAQAAERR